MPHQSRAAMSHNTFGHLFRVTTWGESHGPAIGCVVDGCPPRIPISEAEIQHWHGQAPPGPVALHHPAPRAGHGAASSPASSRTRRAATLLTTGTPISLLIENVDARSKDYAEIKDSYRPGHADFTYQAKYGIRDWRGSGRASARETADARRRRRHRPQGRARHDRPRRPGADRRRTPSTARAGTGTRSTTTRSSAPTPRLAPIWEEYLDDIRKRGSSIGAVIEVVAEGVPAGLGAPIYGKLDQDIASAMMSINAVKGVEIGAGFAAAALTGEENADEMRMGNDGKPVFLSNHAGGILGGISTGQPIVVRFAVKPTSSILTPRRIDQPAPARRSRSRPRAATTPASASAPCRSARRCSPSCSPTTISAIAARSAG